MRSSKEASLSTTPSAPLKEASRLLVDVAASPPVSGGEWRAGQFMHTFYDRAFFGKSMTLVGEAIIMGGNS
jgi:hypothetical protein